MINSNINDWVDTGKTFQSGVLHIDVIADFSCPWSYIGKRRLDEALASVKGPSLVLWHPFRQNPELRSDGLSLHEYLYEKYGHPERLKPAMDRLLKDGLLDGIDFRFDRIRKIPQTLDAHRLMFHAQNRGLDGSKLAELIMQAFFTEGRDISDFEVLADLAAQAGLSRAELHEALADTTNQKLVLAQEAQMRKSGVSGVPDFLINKRLFVLGLQPTDDLVTVFDRAMFGAESEHSVSETLH